MFDRPPKTEPILHVDREHAGAIVSADASSADARTTNVDPRADFNVLFKERMRVTTVRVLRLITAVASNDWPDDNASRLELVKDLQRLCRASHAELERLKELLAEHADP